MDLKANDVMEEITLWCKGADEEVCTVVMPRFNPRPEAILWGIRTFLWDNASQKYCEGFMYAVPPGMTKP